MLIENMPSEFGKKLKKGFLKIQGFESQKEKDMFQREFKRVRDKERSELLMKRAREKAKASVYGTPQSVNKQKARNFGNDIGNLDAHFGAVFGSEPKQQKKKQKDLDFGDMF